MRCSSSLGGCRPRGTREPAHVLAGVGVLTVVGGPRTAPSPLHAVTAVLRSPGRAPTRDLLRQLRVLLVEDSAADAELTVERLDEAMRDVDVAHVVRLRDAVSAMAITEFDVALVDLSLPDAADLEAVVALRQACPTLAVVVLTGHEDEDLAHRALAVGAQDYLLKGDLDAERLGRALRYAVSRARSEADAEDSRAWAQSVLDSVDAPTCVLDSAGTIMAINLAWRRFTTENGGVPERCGVGTSYLAVCDAADGLEVRRFAEDLRTLLSTGIGRIQFDYPCPAPDRPRWFTVRATPAVGHAQPSSHTWTSPP